MQKVVNKLRKSEGYIAIEAIICAGLIIGLGALSIASFQTEANGVTGKALAQVNKVQTNYNGLVAPTK